MIKQFCEHLGLQFLRQEGDELIHVCPMCGSKKFYINSITGAWQCFGGCSEKGHPYQLVKHIHPDWQPKAIFELLSQFGIKSDSNGQKNNAQDAPQSSKPLLADADIHPIPLLDQLVFCHAKSLDRTAFMSFLPARHRQFPWILFPAYSPKQMDRPCGWIRAGIDGSKIRLKVKDEAGNWVEHDEKYPVVKGSKPGLLGLHQAAQDCSETILLLEGFKAALAARSLGYTAIAKSNGVKSWSDDWLSVFAGKRVIIIFDRDAAGNGGPRTTTMPDGSTKVTQCKPTDMEQAKKIRTVAKEVRVVRLPYEYRETNGLDLWDWIVTDKHTREDLDRLIDTAPVFAPPTEVEQVPIPTESLILSDDQPDTIAMAFEKWSIEACNVKHRYHPHNGFTIYRNGKYQSVDQKQQVAKYLSQFLRNCCFKKGKTTNRIAVSNRKLNDVLSQLSYLDTIYLRPKQAAPCCLDGKLDPNHIIATQNGLLDWSTYPYQLMPHTDRYYTLNYLPYEWAGETDSELWINFLFDVTGGNEELFDLLQQWAGYCLMKNNQNEQRFMIVYGEAGTGKSVFVDVLTHLLGMENVAAVPLEKFDDPHYVTQTYGKMLNVTDESETQVEETVESHIKHYTGGTVYTFKRLYQEPFMAYPTAKLMIVTNHLPAFKDVSDGIWRRLLIAPFDNIIPVDKRIRGLAGQIIKTEMPGVLKWALDGARKVEKFGFVVPRICVEKVTEYRNEAIPELTFFKENFEECSQDEQYGRVKCDILRSCYEKWCKGQGIGLKSNKRILKTMKRLYPKYEYRQGREGFNRSYYYYGIRFHAESEFYQEVRNGDGQ